MVLHRSAAAPRSARRCDPRYGQAPFDLPRVRFRRAKTTWEANPRELRAEAGAPSRTKGSARKNRAARRVGVRGHFGCIFPAYFDVVADQMRARRSGCSDGGNGHERPADRRSHAHRGTAEAQSGGVGHGRDFTRFFENLRIDGRRRAVGHLRETRLRALGLGHAATCARELQGRPRPRGVRSGAGTRA